MCSNGAIPGWDINNARLYVDNLTKTGTSCYLYFDTSSTTKILAGKDIQMRNDFDSILSTNTNGLIFEEQTSDGTTYYFAGDTDENWVSFAEEQWISGMKIILIIQYMNNLLAQKQDSVEIENRVQLYQVVTV